jgi:hypothetical protein
MRQGVLHCTPLAPAYKKAYKVREPVSTTDSLPRREKGLIVVWQWGEARKV